MRLRFCYHILLSLALLCCSQWVYAIEIQTLLPSSTEPGQVAKDKRTSPMLPPTGGAPVAPQKAPAQGAIAGAENIKFKLTKVIFKDNTVFSQAQLEPIVQPYYNQEITLAQLQKLTEDIANKYRNAGYILSNAILPPQEIKNGVVTIQVIEGFVDKVTIEGNPGRAKKLLAAYGQKIEDSRPLNMKVLERYILLANDIPGVTAKAVLTPSKTVPGASDLAIVTDKKTFQGSLSYDNFGTLYLGPNEYTAIASANSVFRPGDSTNGRFIITEHTNELRYWDVSHTEPLGSRGATLALDANFTDTNPDFILEPLDDIGHNKMLTADVSYPIIRSRSKNLFVHAGFTYQNSWVNILTVPIYNDKVRYIRTGAAFDFSDRFRGSNLMSIDYERGLPWLGASSGQDLSRPDGTINYTKLNGQISRLQGLTSRISALLLLRGQYSFDPLLAAQQFPFGGPDIGRGYDPSEIIADRGVDGKFELRFNAEPNYKILRTIQYYAFYDAGVLWNMDTINQFDRASALSAGGGARINFTHHFNGNFFIGKPITLPVATLVLSGQNGKSIRSFMQVNYNF